MTETRGQHPLRSHHTPQFEPEATIGNRPSYGRPPAPRTRGRGRSRGSGRERIRPIERLAQDEFKIHQ